MSHAEYFIQHAWRDSVAEKKLQVREYTFGHLRPGKAQINLRIHAVWA